MGFEDKTSWIWSSEWEQEDQEKPGILLFRKEFELKDVPAGGILNISADTRYKLYVNGKLAEVGPCKGDRQVWFYDSVNIADHLRKGRNVLAISVLRYPADPAKGNHSLIRTFTPGLYVRGWVSDRSGRVDIAADETWKCWKNKSVSFQKEEEGFSPLMIHEYAYGDSRLAGWKETGYNDSYWKNARSYVSFEMPEAISPGNLFPRQIPFMYRKKRTFDNVVNIKKSVFTEKDWNDLLHGKRELTIPADSEELVEIDAGEEMTAYIYADFCGGKKSKIQLLYAESYLQDEVVGPANVPLKNDRCDWVNGHLDGYKDIYEAAGYGKKDKVESYETYWFRTFRFVQLHIHTDAEPLVLKRIDYEETGYPLKIRTEVKISDKSMHDIWDISARTLQRCMHETYEDCPYYEQLQYAMDSRTQILYTYTVSADDRLARRCMDDLRRSQRADGLLNCCYPNGNPNVIPGFSIYYILMIYDHMMYFGDRELVWNHMPYIENILNYFRKNLTEKGYVGKLGNVLGDRYWSFIDWAKEWNPTSGMPPAGLKGSLTMESLLYICGLQHAAKLLGFLGRKEDAEEYQQQSVQLQNAVRRYCTGSNGMIQDGPGTEEYSQHCQVFAVLTDTVDKETGRKNLLKTIEDKQYPQCTVAMRFYLFRALEKTGLYMYSDQYWEAWRRMLRLNCTTSIESEEYARSECHAWGALALYELPSAVLGVRPDEPGYKAVRIAPNPGHMTYACGKVKTPAGEIQVKWKKENGKIRIEYEAPEGMDIRLEGAV